MPITISGTTGIAGVDGSAGTPAVQGSDTNTGVFYPAANTVAISTNGTEGFRVNSDTQAEFKDGTASLPSIAHSGDLNTGAYFPAADTIGLVTSGSERFRIGSSGQLGIGGATYGTSGQVLASGGASAAPTWTTLSPTFNYLGAITTTSGTSNTLSSLTLTSYSQLVLLCEGVSHSSGTNQQLLLGNSTSDDVTITVSMASGPTLYGYIWVDLSGGSAGAYLTSALGSGNDTPLSTATTTISVAWSGGANFDAGSIRVYGVT